MPKLADHITAALSGFPTKDRLPPAADLEAYIHAAVENPIYTPGKIGDRTLDMPSHQLKFAHRVLHQILLEVIPPFVGVHGMADDIVKALPANTEYIRTDIKKCFPSVSPALAQPVLDTLIGSNTSLDVESKAFALKAVPSVFSTLATGLATGSPASPALLAAFLHDIPQIPGKTFRYVDDILFLGANKAETKQNHDLIADYLTKKGLTLNAAKTVAGEVKDGISFLGLEFGPKAALAKTTKTLPVDLKTYVPIAKWNTNYQIGLDPSLPEYEALAGGNVMYRGDTLSSKINEGSLDALCIAAACTQNPDLTTFVENTAQLISSKFAIPLHGRLYKGYVANVKSPREKGGTVVAPEAEKILTGLLLETHLLEHRKFPTSAELHAKYPNLTQAYADAPTGGGEYHKVIKQLFKREYSLLNGPKRASFKPDDAYLEMLAEQDNVFDSLQHKKWVPTPGVVTPLVPPSIDR